MNLFVAATGRSWTLSWQPLIQNIRFSDYKFIKWLLRYSACIIIKMMFILKLLITITIHGRNVSATQNRNRYFIKVKYSERRFQINIIQAQSIKQVWNSSVVIVCSCHLYATSVNLDCQLYLWTILNNNMRVKSTILQTM